MNFCLKCCSFVNTLLLSCLHSSFSNFVIYFLSLNCVFQIVNDTFTEACVRITKEERQRMKSLFGEELIYNNISVQYEIIVQDNLFSLSFMMTTLIMCLFHSTIWHRAKHRCSGCKCEESCDYRCQGVMGDLFFSPVSCLCEFCFLADC